MYRVRIESGYTCKVGLPLLPLYHPLPRTVHQATLLAHYVILVCQVLFMDIGCSGPNKVSLDIDLNLDLNLDLDLAVDLTGPCEDYGNAGPNLLDLILWICCSDGYELSGRHVHMRGLRLLAHAWRSLSHSSRGLYRSLLGLRG